MKRNLYLLAGSAVLSGVGLYLYASRVAAKSFRLETVDITTYGAAASELDGAETSSGSATGPSPAAAQQEKTFRILHLSDLHLSYPETDKLRFLEQVTDGDYDFVVLTGDVFENFTGIQYASSLLSRRPKIGAYAVLGNHDYYDYSYVNKIIGRVNRKLRHPDVMRDVTPMVHALERAGYDVLRNESRTHDQGVHVVGLDYPGITAEHLKDLAAAAPTGHMVMTVFHMPRGLEYIAEVGTHLGLAGHTHGGQIRVPGIGALITDSELARHEASGVVLRGNTVFHISRGLSADPRSNFRLFCPPAATVITVTHKLGKKPSASNDMKSGQQTAISATTKSK